MTRIARLEKIGICAALMLCFGGGYGLGTAFAAPPPPLNVSMHRALYTMSLDSADTTSGVDGASGSLYYEWGDSCDGWTIQQRYKLWIHYRQDQPVELTSNYVTWESKDGTHFRFNDRETRNGVVDQDIRGEASLDGQGGSGTASFEKPKHLQFALPPGTLFPTAHTLALIRAGLAGQRYLAAQVFDGSVIDGASAVSAVIGHTQPPQSGDVKSALLQHQNWQIWLAFFSEATKEIPPDYALGMRMLENGVSDDMAIDYGNYTIKATMQSIEALPKPAC